MSKGIDYGGGTTNIDRKTGIRFGVISMNEVTQAWSDASEPDYGDPACPKCGNPVVEYNDDTHDAYKYVNQRYTLSLRSQHAEYACEECEVYMNNDDVYGDEPNGYILDNGEYKATQGQDGDIFILSSPYFTRAQFCSPCAPGACYLTNPCDDGERAYCFGHDWFENDEAPYPVYSVKTGRLILPE